MVENYAQLPEEERLNVAIRENVLVQLEHLRIISVVAAKLASGRLHLHGWAYRIEMDEVFAYEPVESQFLALAHYHRKPS